MTVLGLILSASLFQFNYYMKTKNRYDTNTTILAIESALEKFFYENNRYPCPADPTLSPDDLTYGDEGDCSAATPAEPAVIGMLPFKVMDMPAEMALDSWHNKYTFAVMRSMTSGLVTGNTPATMPSILIVPQMGEFGPSGAIESYSPGQNAQYVVLSHGDDGVGAYNVNGDIIDNCVLVGIPPADNENCDGDATFMRPGDRRLWSTPAPGADHFDDIVAMSSQVSARVWVTSPDNNNDIYSQISSIGIGKDFPTANVDVAGNVKMQDIIVSSVCNIQDDNCFSPRMITGSESYMACPSGQVMTGISNGAVVCANVGFVSGPAQNCNAGQYAVGFDASGGLLCE